MAGELCSGREVGRDAEREAGQIMWALLNSLGFVFRACDKLLMIFKGGKGVASGSDYNLE